MKTKLILTKINEFSDIIKNIFQDKEFSDDVKDILQVLSLSSNWIYYNIIFAEENISEWEVDGKIINDLKEEFKKSQDYSISKIKMDKSLLQIYTHFFIMFSRSSPYQQKSIIIGISNININLCTIFCKNSNQLVTVQYKPAIRL